MGMILPKEAEMPPEIRRENRCSGVFRGHFSGNNSIIQRIMDFQLFCKFFLTKNKKWTKILSKKKFPDTFLVLINTRFLDDTKNYRINIGHHSILHDDHYIWKPVFLAYMSGRPTRHICSYNCKTIEFCNLQ
jgi:hypothetical protein